MIIQTQLLGRLFGMRVIRIDGVVQVSPGRPAPDTVPGAVAGAAGGTAGGSAQRSPTGSPPAPGGALAEAARLLRASEELRRLT